MIAFIKVVFWMMVFQEICRLLLIGIYVYPRKVSKGSDLFSLGLNAAFIVWAATLIW